MIFGDGASLILSLGGAVGWGMPFTAFAISSSEGRRRIRKAHTSATAKQWKVTSLLENKKCRPDSPRR